MDRFTEMQTFVAVVDAGSFVGASDALGVSKAAASRHVGELEARLGVRLLHRTTRRLSLTVEGEVFYARCKTLLGEVDEAEAEVTARAGEAIGQLRVNVPVTFGNLHLAPLWGAFREKHPRVMLDVTLADRVVDLVDEGYDLAVRIARLPDSTLVSRTLASTRLVLCASPGYLARAGTPRRPGELADHATWSYAYSATGDEWHFDGPDGPAVAKIRPVFRTNSGDTSTLGALDDQGIVLEPDFIVGPYLDDRRLVEVMPEYRARELGIYAVYPTRRHVATKVRVLIDFLAEAFLGRRWRAAGAAAPADAIR